MKFVCEKHGEQEQVQHDGYGLARGGLTPRDLEGIMFTFDVVEHPAEGEVTLELADADGARSYLSKFANWEELVTEAAEEKYEQGCPQCGNGRVMWELEDDESIEDRKNTDTSTDTGGEPLEVATVDDIARQL